MTALQNLSCLALIKQMLYLIPCPIAENALHTLPLHTIEIAKNLDFFIVERAKTARHFIKSLAPAKAIQEMTFIEIGEHDQKESEDAFRQAIKEGKKIGLLSEAGCPGVADPGAVIVELAHLLDVKVVPLVGPSSILLALMASGMSGQQFTFHGYLSAKRPELAKDLKRLEQQSDRLNQTQIFIETPYRSQMVMDTAFESMMPDSYFCIAQDVTGEKEYIRSLRIKDWKKAGKVTLEKLPCIFMVFRGK
jgi:16S rRNA (cytidine1402-2'-O)-methyltransferase